MKKYFICLLFLFVSCGSVYGADVPCIFEENFENCDLSSWNISKYRENQTEVSVEECGENNKVMDILIGANGGLTAPPANTVTCSAGDSAWTDYTLRFKMKLQSGYEYTGIMFRKNGKKYNALTFCSYNRYLSITHDTIYSAKYLENTRVNMSELKDFNEYDWNNYQISVYGLNVKIYINNKMILDFIDTENVYLSGNIGIGTQSTWAKDNHLLIDDVMVYNDSSIISSITDDRNNDILSDNHNIDFIDTKLNVNFNTTLDTQKDAIVKLLDNQGNSIPVTAVFANSNCLEIQPLKRMDNDKKYIISIQSVIDEYGVEYCNFKSVEFYTIMDKISIVRKISDKEILLNYTVNDYVGPIYFIFCSYNNDRLNKLEVRKVDSKENTPIVFDISEEKSGNSISVMTRGDLVGQNILAGATKYIIP